MNETENKPVAGRAPWKREDALAWALRVAEHQVPVSDVLADASVIAAFFDGELAPVEQAVVTVQRFRDRIPAHREREAYDPWAQGGLVDEFLGDLIRDLRETVVDAEIVDESGSDPESERDRARSTATRLEQELAEKERELVEYRQYLIKGVLMEVLRLGQVQPDRSGVRVAQLAAEKFGVEL